MCFIPSTAASAPKMVVMVVTRASSDEVRMARRPESRFVLEQFGLKFMPLAEGVGRFMADVEAGLPHKVGPNLHGMFGRKAGTAEGFRYTDALVKSGIVWTPETMDAWLKQPGALVPGNGMAFAGIANDADRASLVAWLMANSGAP